MKVNLTALCWFWLWPLKNYSENCRGLKPSCTRWCQKQLWFVTCFIQVLACPPLFCMSNVASKEEEDEKAAVCFIPYLLKNGRRRRAVKMFWEGMDLGSLKCQSVRWGSALYQAVTEIAPTPPTSLTLLILQSCYGWNIALQSPTLYCCSVNSLIAARVL